MSKAQGDDESGHITGRIISMSIGGRMMLSGEATPPEPEPPEQKRLLAVTFGIAEDYLRNHFARTGEILPRRATRKVDPALLTADDRRRLALAFVWEKGKDGPVKGVELGVLGEVRQEVSFNPFTGIGHIQGTKVTRQAWDAPFLPAKDFDPAEWAVLLAAYEEDFYRCDEAAARLVKGA